MWKCKTPVCLCETAVSLCETAVYFRKHRRPLFWNRDSLFLRRCSLFFIAHARCECPTPVVNAMCPFWVPHALFWETIQCIWLPETKIPCFKGNILSLRIKFPVARGKSLVLKCFFGFDCQNSCYDCQNRCFGDKTGVWTLKQLFWLPNSLFWC